ncbi:MAG: hypothetical protein ABW022_17355 [Actinoplanes sp.]
MPSAIRLTLTAALGAALLAAAGCGGTGEANAAGLARGDLVSAMAAQLSAGSALSYTATYQLTGGDTATITQAQRPTRTAYAVRGGRLIVTAQATTRCEGSKCTKATPEPTAAAALPGLVTPQAVLAMLNTAALDPEVQAEQHDTTIAGRHATCLSLRNVAGTPSPDFSVCVTNEGALGSFTANINGELIDLALTDYSDQVSGTDFLLPTS